MVFNPAVQYPGIAYPAPLRRWDNVLAENMHTRVAGYSTTVPRRYQLMVSGYLGTVRTVAGYGILYGAPLTIRPHTHPLIILVIYITTAVPDGTQPPHPLPHFGNNA